MNKSSRFHTMIVWGMAGVLLFLNSCMAGPKYRRPIAPSPPVFKEELPVGWEEAQPSDGALRGAWWRVYNDPILDGLEDQVSILN